MTARRGGRGGAPAAGRAVGLLALVLLGSLLLPAAAERLEEAAVLPACQLHVAETAAACTAAGAGPSVAPAEPADDSWLGLLLWHLRQGFANQLVGGSLVLTLSGGLMAGAVLLVAEARHALHQRLYVTVHVRPTSEVATWIGHWLSHHDVLTRSSRFAATVNPDATPRATKVRAGREVPQSAAPGPNVTAAMIRIVAHTQVNLVPMGTRTVHKVLFQGHLVWIGVEADGQLASGVRGFLFGGGGGGGGHGAGMAGPSAGPAAAHGGQAEGGYTLTALNWSGRGKAVLQELIADAQRHFEARTEAATELYVSRFGSWERVGSRAARKVGPFLLVREWVRPQRG